MNSDDNLKEFNRYRISGGVPPLAPPNKYKRPRSLRMSDPGWEGLRILAERLGYTYGGSGNVTAMLESIGYNQWELKPKVEYEKEAVS